ncbi:TRAM domain-containing protein, partial [candidate division WOR-3 bacterium]|nr:TRAM domain-containing protein [candidate division WOR-3 bacterium]
ETEEDFEATLALVESVRFDYAYMFRFSPRPGTPAAGLKPGVSYADAGRRLSRLIEVQNRVTRERNRELVGRELELLVEGPGPRGNGVLARTAANRAVVVETAAPPGAMLRCRVTRLSGWTPVAEVIRPRAGAARLAAAGCELSN